MITEKTFTKEKIELTNLSIELGTVNYYDTKSFFIVVLGWIKLEDIDILPKLKKELSYTMRAISLDVIPNLLYSFIDNDYPDNLEKSKMGFFALETTFILKENITDFKTNKALRANAIAFGELIESKLAEFSDISFSRRRIR